MLKKYLYLSFCMLISFSTEDNAMELSKISDSSRWFKISSAGVTIPFDNPFGYLIQDHHPWKVAGLCLAGTACIGSLGYLAHRYMYNLNTKEVILSQGLPQTEQQQIEALVSMDTNLKALAQNIGTIFQNLPNSPVKLLAPVVNKIKENPLLTELLEDPRFATTWHQYGIILSGLEEKEKPKMLMNLQKKELESFIDQLYACVQDPRCDKQIVSNTFPELARQLKSPIAGGKDISQTAYPHLLNENYKKKWGAIAAVLFELVLPLHERRRLEETSYEKI